MPAQLFASLSLFHFGVGKAATVKKLEVQWPSGAVESFKDVTVNQILTIKEGAGIVQK